MGDVATNRLVPVAFVASPTLEDTASSCTIQHFVSLLFTPQNVHFHPVRLPDLG
jgi:hypothetical protein